MATYDRYINSDPAIGSDAADGTTPEKAWLTLRNANGLTVGSDFYHFHLTDNGWTYPYRGNATDGAAIKPGYGEVTETDKHVWYCNNAVITGTQPLTATWTRLPGFSYVFYCTPTFVDGVTPWDQDPYMILGLNTGLTWIGEEAILFQRMLSTEGIPSEVMDHCWYWDSTFNRLYICDHSGNPNDTGLILEYGYYAYTIYGVNRGNHVITDARVFPARTIGMDFSGPFNTFFANKFFYGGSDSIVRLSSAAAFHDIGFYYNLLHGSAYPYAKGLLRMDGDSATGVAPKIYNNHLYAGNYGIYCSADMGATLAPLIRNNLFIDQTSAAYSMQTGAVIDEDYNAYGVSLSRYGTLTLGITAGTNSIPADPATESTTNIKIFYPETSLKPGFASPIFDAGVDVSLTEDIAGLPIVNKPEIGCYELINTKKGNIGFYYNI